MRDPWTKYWIIAKMTTAPKTRIDQFMLIGVGSAAVGKKVKIIAKQRYATEKTLIGIPSFPSEKREGGIPPGWSRARTKALMDRIYVVNSAAIMTEAMALKAAVEPILIRLNRTVIMVETSTEVTGI